MKISFWDLVLNKGMALVAIPLLMSIIGGIFLHFGVIPAIRWFASRVSASARERANKRKQKLIDEASSIDSLVQFLRYQNDRNSLQMRAIFQALGATLGVVASIGFLFFAEFGHYKSVSYIFFYAALSFSYFCMILAFIHTSKATHTQQILDIAKKALKRSEKAPPADSDQ